MAFGVLDDPHGKDGDGVVVPVYLEDLRVELTAVARLRRPDTLARSKTCGH